MNFIDTHSHLYLSQFDNDIDLCISRSLEAGVNKIILPNIDSESVEPMCQLAEKDNELFKPLIGLHPTHVKENFEDELNNIFTALSEKRNYGVGEIGIDLYWEKTFIEEQKVAFEKQVRYALAKDLPIVIHSRESYCEILEVLKMINCQGYKGIFHAFPGNSEQAHQVIEMGFYIGIGGVVTFKNSHLPEVVSKIDLNHIVLETDSPYLAPVPYRGKRNESCYIPIIAEKIAELSGSTIEEVARHTTDNASKLFKI
ncbi:MAG: TatD family hydrolase [Bacteroidales bacterium]|nr:TatD family hydrolase [Bacteroidales bacterium]MBN2821468.1 TatD family hydrolase [Bacteroidales bacterium]